MVVARKCHLSQAKTPRWRVPTLEYIYWGYWFQLFLLWWQYRWLDWETGDHKAWAMCRWRRFVRFWAWRCKPWYILSPGWLYDSRTWNRTYRHNAIIRTVAQNMIKCSHQNLRKCLFALSRKLVGWATGITLCSPLLWISSAKLLALSVSFSLNPLAIMITYSVWTTSDARWALRLNVARRWLVLWGGAQFTGRKLLDVRAEHRYAKRNFLVTKMGWSGDWVNPSTDCHHVVLCWSNGRKRDVDSLGILRLAIRAARECGQVE